MKKNYFIFLCCLLAFVIFFGFFYDIGIYPLLDIDETRYVTMARDMFYSKDYLTLYLNGDYFFEKPPLFFWIEVISFHLFGFINEYSARIPLVLLSLLPCGLLFDLCLKTKGKRFAIFALMVLSTSLEYVFMTKIAILDSVFTSFLTSSILCYFYTFYVKEENKKYFWILTYVFSAFAVLSKGLGGVLIPAGIIFISSIIFKSYKETIKYSYLAGLFLLIALPWHIIMLKNYGDLFFNEYIVKHHFLRFLGSEIIHKNQSPWFYLLTLLWGLFPHIFIFLAQIFKIKIKNINFKDKFLTLNILATFAILIFFSLSGAKLITYILPIYPFLAVVVANVWIEFFKSKDKPSFISLILLNSFLALAIVILCFCASFVPFEIYQYFQKLQIASLLILTPFVVLNFIFLFRQKRVKLFLSYVVMMALISGFLTPLIYEFNYSFGQDDLIRFAKLAKEKNYTISTYLTGSKYSLLYWSNQKKIVFWTKKDLNYLENELKKPNNITIVRNKHIKELDVKIKEKGIKYSIAEAKNER